MTQPFNWPRLLGRWNQDVLRCPRVVDRLPPAVLQKGWLGFSAATDDQVREAEIRLKTLLPPSFSEFLKSTNGWWEAVNLGGKVWSAEDVQWFRTGHEDVIADWIEGARAEGGSLDVPDDEYSVYGEAQRPESLRLAYLQAALQVSEMIDGCVYLLNPLVVTADGEWEAWFLAPWLPGAVRYRSFWDMMEAEYRMFTC